VGEKKQDPPRRPYRKPRLVRLGTLSEITAAVSNKGATDGGSGMSQKTH